MRFDAVLAFLNSASIATAIVTDGLCSTKLGPSSINIVPTATKTQGLSLTAYILACASVTKTVTPLASTTSLTDTITSTFITTAPQVTDTITTTETGTITNTEAAPPTTITSTFTATTTITSSGTVTIPTSAGFTPVASDVTYVAKKRDVPNRLSLVQRAVSKQVQQVIAGSGGSQPSYSPACFPQAVNCVKINKVVTTKTLTIPFCTKTKTTTLIPLTATIRSTVTATATSIVYPVGATATSTVSITVTTVTTTTSTQTDITTTTETQTSVAPSATVFAACASNNLISTANGNHGVYIIQEIDTSISPNTVVRAPQDSAYNCCVACQQTANCVGTAFFAPNGNCDLIFAPTCGPGNTFGTFYKTKSDQRAGIVFVSNGPCGRIPNAGDF